MKPFYPFLLDPEGFERRLIDFLQTIGENGLDARAESFLRESTFRDAAWYGLMLAVLGSGCQFSDMEPKDRILRTRVFGVFQMYI